MWAVKATGSLARRNPVIKQKLASLGLCERFVPLFHQFTTTSTPLSESTDAGVKQAAFLESICWCIGNLGYPDQANQSRLGVSGAYHIICQSLALCSSFGACLHSSNSVMVVQEGLRALRSISHNHPANLKLLFEWRSPLLSYERPGHLCDLLSDFMSVYSEQSDVLQWIWFAVASLSTERHFLTTFGSLRICEFAANTITK